MLGDTITVTLDGAGGTPVTLNKINQDAYASEYFKKQTDNEIRMTIKHSRDNVKVGSQPFDRHTVTLEQYFYPTEVKPQGCRYQQTLIMRNDPSGVEEVAVNLGEALTHWATDINLIKLFGWES